MSRHKSYHYRNLSNVEHFCIWFTHLTGQVSTSPQIINVHSRKGVITYFLEAIVQYMYRCIENQINLVIKQVLAMRFWCNICQCFMCVIILLYLYDNKKFSRTLILNSKIFFTLSDKRCSH